MVYHIVWKMDSFGGNVILFGGWSASRHTSIAGLAASATSRPEFIPLYGSLIFRPASSKSLNSVNPLPFGPFDHDFLFVWSFNVCSHVCETSLVVEQFAADPVFAIDIVFVCIHKGMAEEHSLEE